MPYRSAADSLYISPLLPFERDLIALIGCSEAEYQEFKRQTVYSGKVRPAAYANIPDIRCDPVTLFLINLAVGIALSAVSALLAPKPQSSDIQQKVLRSDNGRRRFNPTSNLEGAADLAQFGTRVPVPFGRYMVLDNDKVSGGLLISPLLVWSRMYSYGKSQGYKGLFVVGERGVDPPVLEGIYIGNNALDGSLKEHYAIYWSNKDGDNRIKTGNLVAGLIGAPGSADPERPEDTGTDEVFICPTSVGQYDTGFCATHRPSNTTEFGAYSPIFNGTALKLNWKVISVTPATPNEQQDRLKDERQKIAGKEARWRGQGMRGTGRGYTPCMGLVAHNGTRYELPTMVTINKGDTVTFRISDKLFDDDEFDKGSEIDLEDVEQRTITMREAADDALQLGEIFLIGRMLFQVTERPKDSWRKADARRRKDFYYTLKCTGGLGHNQIQLSGSQATVKTSSYHGKDYEPWWVGPNNFPLLRVALGTVRNIRPVETTEIGIRSRVWNKANGLCNFSQVPTPERMIRFDEDDVQLTTGYTSRYFARSSAFTIQLRPAGLDSNGAYYPWALLGEQFVVTSEQPVDVYNFIRIKGEKPQQMEFRFVPKCGADIRTFTADGAQFWRLNASTGTLIGDDYETPYGRFRLTMVGEKVTVVVQDTSYLSESDITSNTIFRTKGRPAGGSIVKKGPSALERYGWLPAHITVGRVGAYHTALLGAPTSHKGQTRHVDQVITAGTRSITLRIVATSTYVPNHPYYGGWAWDPNHVEIVGFTGNWGLGDTFQHDVPVNNDYLRGFLVTALYRVTNVGEVWLPGVPAQEERWFELRSQISDISHFEEVEKSNAGGPEHSIVYVNESTAEENGAANYYNLTMMGLALRSGVNFTSIDQIRAWVPNGVHARRFGWNDTVGPANKFSDLVYYLLTDKVAGIGKRLDPKLIDEAGFTRTSKFLINYDIHFDGVLADQTNLRTFFAEYGPLNLCNFTVKNGRFTMEPALPCNDEGQVITGPLPISAIFTAGNIIEGSFSIEFLDTEDRMAIRAAVVYRKGKRNEIPTSASFTVQWADEPVGTTERQENFDMSLFCTMRDQAFMAARYLMSVRRRVSHIVKFQTTPEGLGVTPGGYIKLYTEAAPTSSYGNGVVLSDGTVQCLTELKDGTYPISVWHRDIEQAEDATLVIDGGRTTDTTLFNSLFTVKSTSTTETVYQVEEVGLTEEGLVEITASHHPLTSTGGSLIVADVFDESRFTIVE